MTTIEGPSSPQTRMLLASEGSTTTLLEALVGEELRLRLDEVCHRQAGACHEAARRALGVDPTTPVLIRKSALITAAGVEISRNVVVARAPSSGVVRDVLTSSEPIGKVMNGSRAGHRRILLDVGWSMWGDEPCAYKSYLIVENDEPSIHVLERFNPRFIPTEGYPVVRQRPPSVTSIRSAAPPPSDPGPDPSPARRKAKRR